MKKFVFVYHGSDVMENADPETRKASMEKWMGWFGTFKDKMVDGGNPFASGGKSVSAKGATTVSHDMMPATGYTIINAKDMDEAVAVAKGCPLVESASGTIEVYEAMPM